MDKKLREQYCIEMGEHVLLIHDLNSVIGRLESLKHAADIVNAGVSEIDIDVGSVDNLRLLNETIARIVIAFNREWGRDAGDNSVK